MLRIHRQDSIETRRFHSRCFCSSHALLLLLFFFPISEERRRSLIPLFSLTADNENVVFVNYYHFFSFFLSFPSDFVASFDVIERIEMAAGGLVRTTKIVATALANSLASGDEMCVYTCVCLILYCTGQSWVSRESMTSFRLGGLRRWRRRLKVCRSAGPRTCHPGEWP